MSEKKLVFILGGVRSGKSRFALEMANRLSTDDILFVATAEAKDDEMKTRIEKHKKERSKKWKTLEAPRYVGKQILACSFSFKGVVIDCITVLMGNIFNEFKEPFSYDLLEEKMIAEFDGIMDAYHQRNSVFFVVSNEVGMGVVPAYDSGRIYRDILGTINQKFASAADEVFFLIAGIPVKVK